MATNDPNTGTTQTTEPQGNAGGQNQGASGTQNVGTAGRKIAGKYETVEEAVEHGILGLEQAFHSTREDVAKLTRMFEAAVGGGGNNQNPNVDPRGGYAPVGQGARGGYGTDYGRGAQEFDTTEWLTNPSQILEQREQRLMQRVIQGVESVVGNAMVVQEFKRTNSDLVPHEKVVSAFMRETDPSKSYAERLNDAAQLTRKYLANVRAAGGGNANQAPSGSDYTEGPRGPNTAGGPGVNMQAGAPQPGQADQDEKELLDYIAERQADQMARFGLTPPK